MTQGAEKMWIAPEHHHLDFSNIGIGQGSNAQTEAMALASKYQQEVEKEMHVVEGTLDGEVVFRQFSDDDKIGPNIDNIPVGKEEEVVYNLTSYHVLCNDAQ